MNESEKCGMIMEIHKEIIGIPREDPLDQVDHTSATVHCFRCHISVDLDTVICSPEAAGYLFEVAANSLREYEATQCVDPTAPIKILMG